MFAHYAQPLHAEEWTSRCALRLRQHWPTAPKAQIAAIAATLVHSSKWTRMSPESAAEAWVRTHG